MLVIFVVFDFSMRVILKHYVDICNLVDGDVSAEVNAIDYDGMIREGEELAELHEQIVVKLPMTIEGIKACKYSIKKPVLEAKTLSNARS